jgi:hypothetical protein
MIIIKNQFTVKKVKKILFIFLFFTSALLIDSQYSSSDSNDFVEARFLGTGVRTLTGPCIEWPDGTSSRFVTKQVTILYINIGDSWTEQEAC